MDIDSFVCRHQREWDRLAELTGWTGRRAGKLSPQESDELVARYRAVSSQLSFARTRYHDAALTARLSALVGRAGAAIHSNRQSTPHTIGRFFTHTFPATVCRQWRFVLVAALLLLVPAVASAWYLSINAPLLDYVVPPEQQFRLIDAQLAYYKPGPLFFAQVLTNNVRATGLVFAAGAIPVAPCIGPALMLALNGYNVGQLAAVFHRHGLLSTVLLQIIPHGMLELSAVILGGAGGLCLGWSLLAPGERTRSQAVAEEGRRGAVLLTGAALMLVVAATIEGFITGSPALGPWVKAAIGLSLWLLFVVYIVVLGRRALAQGVTGQLSDDEGGWADDPGLGRRTVTTRRGLWRAGRRRTAPAPAGPAPHR